MAAELENRMLDGLQGPGPGGGTLALDGLDWDSSLFDELSDLVDVDDMFQDDKCNTYVPENSFDNLDFNVDLLSWNPPPWDCSHQYYAGDSIKPEPLSPASSSYSVQSPHSVDSLSSSSQYVPEDLDVSSNSQMSPLSMYSEGTQSPRSEQLDEKPIIINSPQTVHTPIKQRKLAPVIPKPSIQPKTILIPRAADIQSTAGISPKTIILQPVTTLLPKQQPLITLQPAPPSGQQVLLAPSAVLQLPAPGILATQSVLTMGAGTSSLPTNLLSPACPQNSNHSVVKPFVQTSIQGSESGANVNVIRRQQRMIKNRESALQSRKKKKEYMQGLELRLRAALSENERLMKENGSLQKLLEEVVSENQKLKVTAPKRRAVCLMMLAVFLILNFNPLSILETGSSLYDVEVVPVRHNRHLLEFSDGNENIETNDILQETRRPGRYISNEKALMVVKEEPLLYIPAPPPCRPLVNQTQTLRLNQELRGWVHRHEAERTKSRRMTNSQKARAIQKPEEKSDTSQLVTMQYTDTSLKNSVKELQIYYSSPRSYQDFLEAIHRRGDTFYVVSFRRDHLLLPATNRNKTSRPKMSIILPSTNVNVDKVINGQDYEVMMQIDCEVMDTRILHVKASSIPPFLREHRENQTNSFYSSPATGSEASHFVGAISESPL